MSHFRAKADPAALWDPTGFEKLSRPRLTERVEAELLNDLGLEWKEDRTGGLLLVPKAEFGGSNRVWLGQGHAVEAPPKPRKDINYTKLMAKHGGWKDAERYYFPTPAARDAFVAEMREAGHEHDAEVVLAHTTIKSGGKKK